MKSWKKIVVIFILILKRITFLTSIYLSSTRVDKNKLDINNSGNINDSKIDSRIANLLSSIKNISSRVRFCYF